MKRKVLHWVRLYAVELWKCRMVVCFGVEEKMGRGEWVVREGREDRHYVIVNNLIRPVDVTDCVINASQAFAESAKRETSTRTINTVHLHAGIFVCIPMLQRWPTPSDIHCHHVKLLLQSSHDVLKSRHSHFHTIDLSLFDITVNPWC